MPKILISNVDNESMMGDQRGWTREFCLYSAMLATRHVWFAEPGDIVVLPRPISESMKRYVFQILGYSSDAVTFIVPEADPDFPRPLGSKQLLCPAFINTLQKAMGTPTGWVIWPYIFDRGIANLVTKLELSQSCGSTPFLLEGGAELINDKSIFRAIAAGRGVKLAPGRTVTTSHELIRSIHDLIGHTGSVIVKQTRHSAADGNAVLTTAPDTIGNGAAVVIQVDVNNLESSVGKIWNRLAFQEQTSLVVETYYQVEKSVCAEFQISHANSSVSLLNRSEIRLNPGFLGLIIPPKISSQKETRFVSGATEIARAICDMGFDGLINVDGIVTTNNEVIFNEVNARTGGCSHAHHICTQLMGIDYENHAVIVSNNKFVASDLKKVFDSITKSGLLFDRTRSQGVVITAEDVGECGVFEALSIGQTQDEALLIELELERAIRN